jgi:hypothetical protein
MDNIDDIGISRADARLLTRVIRAILSTDSGALGWQTHAGCRSIVILKRNNELPVLADSGLCRRNPLIFRRASASRLRQP